MVLLLLSSECAASRVCLFLCLRHGLSVESSHIREGQLLTTHYTLDHFVVLGVLLVHVPRQVDVQLPVHHIGRLLHVVQTALREVPQV